MKHKEERRKGGQGIEGHLVRPGEIVLVHDGTLLVSVVSMGVSVCLWEHGGTLAGMAHFLEPRVTDPLRATARYGNVAVSKLIQMARESSPAGALEAQIFGGAHPPGKEDKRGVANVEMARKVLVARGIPIVSEDIGGSKGRKLLFDSKNGHVAVIRVHHLRAEDWH